MLPAFLLSLREGIEAALIIGIVLGVLRKIQRTDGYGAVWGGAISAAILSALAAIGLYRVGAAFEGPAEMIFEGFAMILAAGVLTWMVFWMHRQARTIKSELEAEVKRATIATGKKALFVLAFIAVLREGIELALFLTAASAAAGGQQTLVGASAGLIAAVFLGWALFKSTIRLDLRRFFLVTGALLIMFAAGLLAHGVHEFNEVGWIPVVVEHVWDTNHLIAEDSTVGEMLKALFGYNGNPSLTELIAYFGYLAAIAFGLQRRRASMPTVQEA